jgi:HSP20 family molecular chaperone IbpA
MVMEAAIPPVNVYEGNGQLSVATPIPGAHPEQTEVVVEPMSIQVSARCRYAQDSQHYHRHDWQVGAWSLRVDLPHPVDPASARATLNLGVLVVMAPLAESGAAEAYRPPVTEAR